MLADEVLAVEAVAGTHCMVNGRQIGQAPHRQMKDGKWIVCPKNEAIKYLGMMPEFEQHAHSVRKGQG